MEHVFESNVYKSVNPAGTWHFIDVPLDVEQLFGKNHAVPVIGKLNGIQFKSSIMYRKESMLHLVPINKETIKLANVEEGDRVHVALALDTESRDVALEEDLALYLEEEGIMHLYEMLGNSHRKYLSDQLNGSKKLETRINRLSKMGDLIRKWTIHKT